jgi:hypothetical protein
MDNNKQLENVELDTIENNQSEQKEIVVTQEEIIEDSSEPFESLQVAASTQNADTINKVHTPEIIKTLSQHGKYIRKSLLCPVCSRTDHAQINLMRARDHMSISEISSATGIPPGLLEKHFEKHYLISPQNQKILALKEDTSQEAKEIVAKLMSGEIDIHGSLAAVLKGKAQRLNEIYSTLNEYNARRDIDFDGLSSFEIEEWVALNKLATEIENSIVKTIHLADKKLFSLSKNVEKSAVQAYELQILSKMIDSIQLALRDIESEGEVEKLVIQKIRRKLADYFNAMEDAILKSSTLLSDTDQENKS